MIAAEASVYTRSMIWRGFDAARLNEIANHRTVRPFLGLGMGPLDCTPLVNDYRNVLLLSEHGAFLYHWKGGCMFEVHSMVLPEGRGEHALAAARASLDEMFRARGARRIVTIVPINNLPAFNLAKRCGFSVEAREAKAWRCPDGRLIDLLKMAVTAETAILE